MLQLLLDLVQPFFDPSELVIGDHCAIGAIHQALPLLSCAAPGNEHLFGRWEDHTRAL